MTIFDDSYQAMWTPREMLISAFTAATSPEHARKIVEALDQYLDEGEGRAAMPFRAIAVGQAPELEAMRKERDAALARAEKAERDIEKAREALKLVDEFNALFSVKKS